MKSQDQTRRPPRSRRRLCLRIMVVLLAFALALFAAEGILRIFGPDDREYFQIHQFRESERGKFCRYDSELGWVGKPHVEDTFTFVDCEHRVCQNSYGFRGKEYSFARSQQGESRLVVLGDSFVWGFGVEDDELFTSRLDEALSDLEVVNLGVSGYGTDQSLLLWRRLGIQFQPDHVLVVITPYTDIWENMKNEAHGYPKPYFRIVDGSRFEIMNQPVPSLNKSSWSASPISNDDDPSWDTRHWLAKTAAHSSLVSSLIQALAKDDDRKRRWESSGVLIPRDYGFSWQPMIYETPPSPGTMVSWTLLMALLDQLVTEIEDNGAKAHVLVVPEVIRIYEDLWEDFVRINANEAQQDHPWKRDTPRDFLLAWAKDRGISWIDPTNALRESAPKTSPLYFSHNSHWSAEGHRIVFEVLQKAFAK